MIVLYRLLSPVLAMLLPMFARFSPKLAATLRWRRESSSRPLSSAGNPDSPGFWIHAASAGELEQARPLIAGIRRRLPSARILLSLGSISARPANDQVEGCDLVIPLPADRPGKMRALVQSFRPRAILIVKWDLWPHMLLESRRAGVPVFLLGAVLSPRSGRARWPARRLYRRLHNLLEWVDAVSEEDGKVFLALGLPPSRLHVSGDPRFDRVLSRIQEKRPHALSEAPVFEQCLLAGSTWPVEEDMILDAYASISRDHPSARLVLVPHEPTEIALLRIEEVARKKGIPVSRLSQSADLEAGALLLGDVKGQLAELYSHADIAYVGGGFTSGVHSVLEAAAQELPLLFGPGIDRAVEARGLLEAGAAHMVSKGEDLKSRWRELLEQRELRDSMGKKARRFTEAGGGASQRSLELLFLRLNLPDKSREKV